MMTGLVMTTHFLIFGQMLILTRSLGPELYGLMTSALVYQNYLFLFSSTGFRALTIREGILHPDAYDQVVTTFLTFTGSFSMILCLVSVLGAALVEFQSDVRLLVCLLAVGNIASWFSSDDGGAAFLPAASRSGSCGEGECAPDHASLRVLCLALPFLGVATGKIGLNVAD